MRNHYKVAFLGFSATERQALASYLRLAAHRKPQYTPVQMLTEADVLVADADHGPSVQLVVATDRLGETVFIGAQRPAGALGWMKRPIDALQVMRELDRLVNPEAGAADAVEMADPVEPADPVTPAPAVAPPPTVGTADTPEAAAPEVAAEPEPDPRRRYPEAPVLIEQVMWAATPPPRPAPPPPEPPPAPRALLVDDSEIALRFLETRLQRWGLQIDTATDSAGALALMAEHSYALVFLDIELGDDSELDGLALCRHVKQSAAAVDAALVMVSAHHSELDRVRGALAGCDAYLAKPLDEIELRRVLMRQGLKAPAREGATPS